MWTTTNTTQTVQVTSARDRPFPSLMKPRIDSRPAVVRALLIWLYLNLKEIRSLVAFTVPHLKRYQLRSLETPAKAPFAPKPAPYSASLVHGHPRTRSVADPEATVAGSDWHAQEPVLASWLRARDILRLYFWIWVLRFRGVGMYGMCSC